MDDLSLNRSILEGVADKIRPLLDDVVFVGGQVVELLLTDPVATRVRVTTDVDVVVTAGSRVEFFGIEERLRGLGFQNDRTEGAPICRWRSPEGHILDLMPVDETILGFSNQWYSAAVERTELVQLRDDLSISIPRPPVFLATKLAAFLSRGSKDLLQSHDLEDVITMTAGRPEIIEELRAEPDHLRQWIVNVVKNLLADPDFAYALQGALPDASRIPEYRRLVRERFEAIASAG